MEFTLTEFALTVICASGAIVCLLSFLSWWTARQNEKRSLRMRIICRLCLHAYEESEDVGLSQCPDCRTQNKRNTSS